MKYSTSGIQRIMTMWCFISSKKRKGCMQLTLPTTRHTHRPESAAVEFSGRLLTLPLGSSVIFQVKKKSGEKRNSFCDLSPYWTLSGSVLFSEESFCRNIFESQISELPKMGHWKRGATLGKYQWISYPNTRMVYLPAEMVDFYGFHFHVGKYTIHWVFRLGFLCISNCIPSTFWEYHNAAAYHVSEIWQVYIYNMFSSIQFHT